MFACHRYISDTVYWYWHMLLSGVKSKPFLTEYNAENDAWDNLFIIKFPVKILFQRTDNLIINIDSKVSCCNYKISCLHFLLSKKGISLKNQLSVVLAAALPHPYPACAKMINWLVAEAALIASEIFFVRDLLLVCLGRGFTDRFEKTNFVMTWISIFCCFIV